MGIIIRAMTFILGSTNLKGKAVAIFAGLPLTVGFVQLLEHTDYLPKGSFDIISNINLSPASLYLIWACLIIFLFRSQINKILNYSIDKLFPSPDTLNNKEKRLLQHQASIQRLKRELADETLLLLKTEIEINKIKKS